MYQITGCGASVARQVRDLEARGSIPRTPTITISTQKYCVKLQAEKSLPALDKIPAHRYKLRQSSQKSFKSVFYYRFFYCFFKGSFFGFPGNFHSTQRSTIRRNDRRYIQGSHISIKPLCQIRVKRQSDILNTIRPQNELRLCSYYYKFNTSTS